MEVIATKAGHDGRQIREPGERFEVPDGAKGSWFKPVGSERPGVRAPKEVAAIEATTTPGEPDGAMPEPDGATLSERMAQTVPGRPRGRPRTVTPPDESAA